MGSRLFRAKLPLTLQIDQAKKSGSVFLYVRIMTAGLNILDRKCQVDSNFRLAISASFVRFYSSPMFLRAKKLIEKIC